MTALNPAGWRPEMGPAQHPGAEADTVGTVTGNRGLQLEEPLLFEIGALDRTGVDFEACGEPNPLLAPFLRKSPVQLPGLSEPEAVRHYTRLSRQNYAIDLGLFPLGSCTMKHNPRLDEKLARLGPDVAAVMITNPNTCGLFEPEMKRISDLVHAAGGLVYCDGANFNAIVGKVRPGDLGIDAMHINLHKTFSTPHGGGGPGSGPVVLSEALSPFGPLPFTARMPDGSVCLVEEEDAAAMGHASAFGRMAAVHGQMGMFTRALTYILSHGADGLRQVAEDAVLNANYLLRRLDDVLDAPFGKSGPCMHEALFSDAGFAGGLSTLDLAKGLIDEGYHPMTVYFPLVVHGAMLVEPTETESKASLDQFIAAVRSIAQRAKAGDPSLKAAPIFAPRRRLDETLAARKPVLTWGGDAAPPGEPAPSEQGGR